MDQTGDARSARSAGGLRPRGHDDLGGDGAPSVPVRGEQAHRDARALHERRAASVGSLVLGATESVLSSWGAPLLARAREVLPTVDLVIHAHRSPVVIDRVQNGEYMAGIVAGSCERAPDLAVTPLLQEPMVLIPPGLRRRTLRRKPPWRVITIEPRSATWESIERRARRLGIEPHRTLESFAAIARLAAAGFGHGLVPRGIAEVLGIPASALRPVPGLDRPVSLVARPSMLARPPVSDLAKTLHAALRETPPFGRKEP